MERTPRERRLESTIRGIAIAVLLGVYGLLMDEPGASWLPSLLVGAALQFLVLVLRRVVPADVLPMVLYLFELLADAVTVFLFALGVYGGLLSAGAAL
jgi:hypothetical protein